MCIFLLGAFSADNRDASVEGGTRGVTGTTRAKDMPVSTPAELRRFLDFTAATDHGPLLRVAAMARLRRGELCGLRWVDVDRDAARLLVRETVVD